MDQQARKLALALATLMVYSTEDDQSTNCKIPDRANRTSPDLFVPWRDFRYRSRIQQHRGMVALDPRGDASAQGSAILPPARGELGLRIRRLRVRAKSPAGRFRRADPAFAGCRNFREGQIGRLSPAQSLAELT